MRYLIASVLAALALSGPAYASGGHIVAPAFSNAWTAGSAAFAVTNSTCATPCSWRAVAASLPALYECPGEPFLGVANIAWQSDDYTAAGTVAAFSTFAGPGVTARVCLYLDRRDAQGGEHFLLAADTRMAPDGSVAESFEALIADPAAVKPKPKRRHRHHRAYVKRSRTRTSTAH
jgi:hypothetical protein